MRYLVFSDVQATDGGEVCFQKQGTRLQEWRVQKFLRFLLKTYKENRCDGLIDLGDATDDRSAIPVPTINTLFSGLAKFPEDSHNLKLIGNHEQYTRNATVDVGALFTPFFTVYSEPAVLEYPEHVLVMAPYPASHDDLNQWLLKTAARCAGRKSCLLGHFQAVGSVTTGGMLMEGIPKETLKHFTLTLLGHIHKPQALLPSAFYVGSPFQQNWGEAGEEKRVGILSVPEMTVKWLPVDGFPVYKTVTLADFIKESEQKSENRYEVVVHNSDEATELYAHPLANRVRPRYDYTQVESAPHVDPQSWDTVSVMKRYLNRNPCNLDITSEEMLESGLVVGDVHNRAN